MPHGRGRSAREPGPPDTWPGLMWRLAEQGGAEFWRGLLLMLVFLLAFGLAGLMGGDALRAVVGPIP